VPAATVAAIAKKTMTTALVTKKAITTKHVYLPDTPDFPPFSEAHVVDDPIEAMKQDPNSNVLYISSKSKVKDCLRKDDSGKYVLDFSRLDLSSTEETEDTEAQDSTADDDKEPDQGPSGGVSLPTCRDSKFKKDPIAAVAQSTAEPFVLYCPFEPGEGKVTGIYKDDKGKIYATKGTVEKTHDLELAKRLYEKFGPAVTLYYLVPDFNYKVFKLKGAASPAPGIPCRIFYLKVDRPSF
jgi:hypothetical protein